VLIVDDVITAGTAIRQSMDLLATVQAKPVGVALALDRQEKGGDTPLSAVQSVQQEFGLHVVSIVGLNQLLAYLQVRKQRGQGLWDVKELSAGSSRVSVLSQ
jgi:orotate phosphoribosyltransferase